RTHSSKSRIYLSALSLGFKTFLPAPVLRLLAIVGLKNGNRYANRLNELGRSLYKREKGRKNMLIRRGGRRIIVVESWGTVIRGAGVRSVGGGRGAEEDADGRDEGAGGEGGVGSASPSKNLVMAI